MERTKKQWHRYFVEEISNIVANNINKDLDVFVECGVKQGSSSTRMATRLGVQGFLFDTWSGFPGFSDMDVSSEKGRGKMKRRVETAKDTYSECICNLKNKNVFGQCEMVRGDILKTVPFFVDHLTDFSIAMMHIDTDLYEPAKISLESFWPHVKEGGVVYFHDYGDKKWRGIKKVVDNLVMFGEDLYSHIFDKNKLFSACVVKGKNGISEDIYDSIVSLDK
jgi:hypothetical protein